MAAIFGKLEEFYMATGKDWKQYIERMEYYFQANKITEGDTKRAVLISVMGEKAYKLMCSLISPAKPNVKHVPGKSLHTADALSQAPLEYTVDSDKLMEIQEIECHIPIVVDTLPVSSTRLTAITQAQADDPVCNTLISCHSAGWLVKSSLPYSIKLYRKYQGELSVHDNLLL